MPCHYLNESLWDLMLRPAGPLLTPLITLRLTQHGRHFADDTFKRIFSTGNVRISIKISLKFVSQGPINNIPALVEIMAWCQTGDKPLPEPMFVNLLIHICIPRPQWVNSMYFLMGAWVSRWLQSTDRGGQVLQAISSIMVIQDSCHHMISLLH